MAGQEFPSSIDRCLLTSAAAALTAASIGPGAESAEAANHDFVKSAAVAGSSSFECLCATARRLLEIGQPRSTRPKRYTALWGAASPHPGC
jgi:hypothetical protein